jgi:SAM-dependent methyltransferase
MDNSACSRPRANRERDTRNLFEDCAWLYAFCREYLFRDHTEQIARALFPNGIPSVPTSVLEVGCGPGFYSRKFAQRFPNLHVVGIDKSSRLVSFAREKASADRVTNCRFLEGADLSRTRRYAPSTISCEVTCARLCSRFRICAALSPMTTQGAIVFPVVMRGITEESAIRRPAMPCTFRSPSTTDVSFFPILAVPLGCQNVEAERRMKPSRSDIAEFPGDTSRLT